MVVLNARTVTLLTIAFTSLTGLSKVVKLYKKQIDKRQIRVINKKHIAQNRLKKALPYFFLMPYITTNDFVLKYNFYSIINEKR
jgi:hypothetical protein